jgi:MoxR-like ATPase
VQAQSAVKAIYVDRLISEYIVNITAATREHEDIYLGASPRGSLGVYRASQARAAMHGRDFVTPDDVKAVAVSVLSHRLILNAAARMRQLSTGDLLGGILSRVVVPGARAVAR